MAAQQYASSMQLEQHNYVPSGLPVQQPAQYQTAYMWNPDELQDMYRAAGNPTNFPSAIIPPARCASANSNPNMALKHAIHRMQEEREQKLRGPGQKHWDSFPQQIQSVMHKEQVNGYARSMQTLSVQPENISPKVHSYLSCMTEFLFSPCSTLTSVDRHFSPYPRFYPHEEFF